MDKTMSTLAKLKNELQQLASPKQQQILQRFFKTGKGEYGEGDIFLGIKVPVQRKLAKKYQALSLTDIQALLQSNLHEYRFTALILLITHYKKADNHKKSKLFDFYLHNTKHIISRNTIKKCLGLCSAMRLRNLMMIRGNFILGN